MKFIHISGYFLLPEDFKGSFSDALRIMADYHDLKSTAKKRIKTPVKDGQPEPNFERFLRVIESGRRCTMFIIMAQQTPRGFVKLPAPDIYVANEQKKQRA